MSETIAQKDVSRDLEFLFRFFAWRTVKVIFSSLASVQALFYPSKRGHITPPENKLLELPISSLVQGIKSCTIRSEDLVLAYIERIKVVNPLINAVVDERFNEALEDARKIDRELRSISVHNNSKKRDLLLKPLLGIPFTCKDSMAVKGMIQSSGSLHRKEIRADSDALAVRRLRSAGAIPLAITNVPECLLWWDSNNMIYGVTRNPYDLSRIAGGSSGGEAALLAASGTAFGLGSDMGGSIRIPSAFCGVFGHKPSPGVVSTDGMFPEVTEGLVPYVAFGPIAKRASELPLLLKAMGEKEAVARLKLDESVEMQSLRMIWMENEGGNPLFSGVSSEILDKLHSAVDLIHDTYGIPCEKVHFPRMLHTLDLWSARIAKADSRKVDDLLCQTSGTSVNPMMEMLKSCFGFSTFSFNILFMATVQRFLGAKAGTRTYVKLNSIADELRQEVIERLGENGFLLCPTMPEEAPVHSSTVLKGADISLCGIFNVLGLPATHVPMGLCPRSGLPIGIQVVTRPDNDRICFAVASALEKMFGGFVHP